VFPTADGERGGPFLSRYLKTSGKIAPSFTLRRGGLSKPREGKKGESVSNVCVCERYKRSISLQSAKKKINTDERNRKEKIVPGGNRLSVSGEVCSGQGGGPHDTNQPISEGTSSNLGEGRREQSRGPKGPAWPVSPGLCNGKKVKAFN